MSQNFDSPVERDFCGAVPAEETTCWANCGVPIEGCGKTGWLHIVGSDDDYDHEAHPVGFQSNDSNPATPVESGETAKEVKVCPRCNRPHYNMEDSAFCRSMNDDETPCPKREDGQHCNCWYDGNACCGCGDAPISPSPVEEVGDKEANCPRCDVPLGDWTHECPLDGFPDRTDGEAEAQCQSCDLDIEKSESFAITGVWIHSASGRSACDPKTTHADPKLPQPVTGPASTPSDQTKCVGCGEIATRPIDAFRLCEKCFNKTINDEAPYDSIEKTEVVEWLNDRMQNALRIADTKHGDDKHGWNEDALFFESAIRHIAHVEQWRKWAGARGER